MLRIDDQIVDERCGVLVLDLASKQLETVAAHDPEFFTGLLVRILFETIDFIPAAQVSEFLM